MLTTLKNCMDLSYDSESVSLSQRKLIDKGLELAGIQECRAVNTPLSEEFNKLRINYRTHTGILNYLACRTRPDLAPAVSILSSFNHAPGINHWRQVIHCWKYLAGSIDLKLTLRPDPQDSSDTIHHYTDATWAKILRLASLAKQRNITLSSTEAELNALSDSVQENQWIKYLIEELYHKELNPTAFHIDNRGLLDKINNFACQSRVP
ncbi:hypothetical protein VP01_567g7 [Puccinia sorghi]|uniref:Reverse transcriptase Ty1/copia-type domain-containing protein n=1 Tax=Puccinia sorghi TaxID=27349 RepID=A0A0L6UIU9_9BASI|nr:hypothetical protein VP01_567g7 [Puccinia sorghi]